MQSFFSLYKGKTVGLFLQQEIELFASSCLKQPQLLVLPFEINTRTIFSLPHSQWHSQATWRPLLGHVSLQSGDLNVLIEGNHRSFL